VAQAHASISANDEDEVESENGESSHIEARKRIANEETQSAKRNISELRRLWRRLRWTPTTTTTTALGSRERFQIFLLWVTICFSKTCTLKLTTKMCSNLLSDLKHSTLNTACIDCETVRVKWRRPKDKFVQQLQITFLRLLTPSVGRPAGSRLPAL
jgi:hypothetical protein